MQPYRQISLLPGIEVFIVHIFKVLRSLPQNNKRSFRGNLLDTVSLFHCLKPDRFKALMLDSRSYSPFTPQVLSGSEMLPSPDIILSQFLKLRNVSHEEGQVTENGLGLKSVKRLWPKNLASSLLFTPPAL